MNITFLRKFLKLKNGKIIASKTFGSFLLKKRRKFEYKQSVDFIKIQLNKFHNGEYDSLIEKNKKKKRRFKKIIIKHLKKLKNLYLIRRKNREDSQEKKKVRKIETFLKDDKNFNKKEKVLLYLKILKNKKSKLKDSVFKKRDRLVLQSKKRREFLIKKHGIENIKKVDNLMKKSLAKYKQTIVFYKGLVRGRTKKKKTSLFLLKYRKTLKKKLKLTKKKKARKELKRQLKMVKKEIRYDPYIRQNKIYLKKLRKTMAYKKRYDFYYLKTIKYDNSVFAEEKRKRQAYNLLRRRRAHPSYASDNLRDILIQSRKLRSVFNIEKLKPYKKRKRYTKFGLALKYRQIFRRFLNNLSLKKLKNLYLKFTVFKKRQNFFINLESTILFTLFRLKISRNFIYLKDLIKKGYVLINKKPIYDIYTKLLPYDIISFKKKNVNFIKLKFAENHLSKYTKPTSNIIFSYSTFSFIYLKQINIKELDYNFNISEEFFSILYRKLPKLNKIYK